MNARQGIRIADATALSDAADRWRLTRYVLLGALVALIAASVVLATRGVSAMPAGAGETGQVTEVVLDVSGSVGDQTFAYTERILRQLSAGGPVGLVVFSDTAEEAMPPGTPASELKPLLRLFRRTHPVPAYTATAPAPMLSPYPVSPWYASFSGGTRISAGLKAAREALTRDHMHGRVVLISDLGDAVDDIPAMRRELVALQQAGIELRIRPLPNAQPQELARFRRLEGPDVARADPAPRHVRAQAPGTGVPATLAALAVLVALVLAANELYGVSMRWQARA